MKGDRIDEIFSDPPKPARFYPGSTTPIPERNAKGERVQKASPVIEVSWDARPVTLLYAGKEMQFYTIGALASALGRQPVTIRLWERKGFLPIARWRFPSKDLSGKRRLYTRAQIEGLVKIAYDEGLMGRKPRDIARTQFPQKALALFQALEI